MRAVMVALAALAMSACTGELSVGEGAGEGYTLEIRASDSEQTYVVTAPDGNSVGARASGGQSALLDATGMQAFASTPPMAPVGEEKVSISAPGFRLEVNAADGESGADGDGGSVALDFGGRSIDVRAEEGGADGDRAHVRITGASAEDAREFIADADEISPAVQAQMLAALGLE